ncbi:MAG: long-chain fatty acid--CoA ligase, partial [Angustibacter sp.]
PSTVNAPDQVRIGSVGRPLPGVSIRLTPQGEVLIRGPHVFRGYHHDPDETAKVLQEGWLHTGDLGTISDGFLTITGRKKEMIVTAAGKNVAPAGLEDSLRAHPLISQCLVIGDQRPFISALITLDEEMLPVWLANHGHPAMEPPKACKSPIIRDEVARAVNQTNTLVSRAESIREFLILPGDFTEQGGQLTPSLKVRRQVVIEECAELIDQLYRAQPPGDFPQHPADEGPQ